MQSSPLVQSRTLHSSGGGGGVGGGGGNEQERRLVAEITAPGGVKAAPPRDMLATFITR